MSNDQKFQEGEQQGILLGELKALRGSVDSLKEAFHDFRSGIGTRMGIVEKKMGEMDVVKDRVDWILKIGSWVIAPTIGFLVLALLGLVYRRH